MLSKNNNAHLGSIIEMLSYTGVSAVLADSRGRIVDFTPRFAVMSGNGKSSLTMNEIFDGLPELSSAVENGDLKLTLKSSGKEITGKRIRLDSADGFVAFVFNDKSEVESGSGPGQNPIVHASDDLVFQFNSAARVYYVSGNVERITGYRAEEFMSGRLHPLDIIHPDDRPALEKEFVDLFTTHKSTENAEHRIIKKNGEIAYLLKSWYALSDTKGNFSGVMGLSRDITKEKLLRERLQLFHSAFEHSNDAIIITGVDGKMIDVNSAFTNIYGYTREEAIGKSTAIVQSKHSTKEFYTEMWNSLTRDNQWRGEIINRKKDGTEIPIWLSITPIYLGEEKIGYMGIESDISERKNLEQQIIQTEKLATIGQLAAGIAHEIGTPLNIISGNAEFMLLDMKVSDPGHQELQTIIEQTKRMSLLMRQLLDFARPKVLSLQSTDINGVIKNVLNFIRLQFKKGEIEIVTRLEDNLPEVYGDPALLYQVFLNVIVNAFQAMARKGTLTIRTETAGKRKSVRKVKIEIADTGEGIPPEHLEKIFTPFFTTKEPGKGTGLGLAVTSRIVQEHNGTIDIKSEFGKGTVVTILFNAFQQTRKN